MGRELDGRANPVTGRPDCVTGRIPWSYPPPLLLVCGVLNDVPGLRRHQLSLNDNDQGICVTVASRQVHFRP